MADQTPWGPVWQPVWKPAEQLNKIPGTVPVATAADSSPQILAEEPARTPSIVSSTIQRVTPQEQPPAYGDMVREAVEAAGRGEFEPLLKAAFTPILDPQTVSRELDKELGFLFVLPVAGNLAKGAMEAGATIASTPGVWALAGGMSGLAVINSGLRAAIVSGKIAPSAAALLTEVAVNTAGRTLALGFAYHAGEAAYNKGAHAIEALQSGDFETASHDLGFGSVEAMIAFLGARHAFSSGSSIELGITGAMKAAKLRNAVKAEGAMRSYPETIPPGVAAPTQAAGTTGMEVVPYGRSIADFKAMDVAREAAFAKEQAIAKATELPIPDREQFLAEERDASQQAMQYWTEQDMLQMGRAAPLEPVAPVGLPPPPTVLSPDTVQGQVLDAVGHEAQIARMEAETGAKSPTGAMQATIAAIPSEVGSHFEAHGVAKGNQLQALKGILDTGLQQGFTAPLVPTDVMEGSGGKGLNTSGGFVVLSEPDASIAQGVTRVIVGDKYYGAIADLQQAYPNVEFIRADDAPARLAEIVQERSLYERQNAGEENAADAQETLQVAATEGAAAPAEAPLPSVHEIVNERNVEYHATDLEGLKGILASGQIGYATPSQKDSGWLVTTLTGQEAFFSVQAGYVKGPKKAAESFAAEHPGSTLKYIPPKGPKVSTSRIARVATKASKAISLVIDSTKIPPNRPFAEEGYRKTGEWNITEGLRKPNPRFEFENRTTGKGIPLSAVKAILVDRSALYTALFKAEWEKVAEKNQEGFLRGIIAGTETPRTFDAFVEQTIAEIRSLAAAHGIPVRVYESGKEMHSTRARLLREKAEALGLSAEQVLARIRARIAKSKAEGHTFFRDESGELDPEAWADVVDYGVYRLAQGVTNFAAWSREIAARIEGRYESEEITPELLRNIYAAAQARAHDPDGLLTGIPAHPNTETVLRALQGVAERIPSDVEAQAVYREMVRHLRADLDRFGRISDLGLGVHQVAVRNPHIPELQAYRRHAQEFSNFADSVRSSAVEALKMYNKLPKKQRRAVAAMAYELTLWSDSLGRTITETERTAKQIEVAKKHGVTTNGMTAYMQFRFLLADFLTQMHDLEVARLRRMPGITPTSLAERIAESDRDFEREMNKEYIPIARFGRYVLKVVPRGTVLVQHNGKTYKGGTVAFFTQSETRSAQAKLRGQLEKDWPADKFMVIDGLIARGTDSHLGYPLAFYRAIEEKLGLTPDQRDDLQQLILSYVPSQAFIQHHQHRRGVPGYSLDLGRSFAMYMSQGANHLARLAYRDVLDDDVAALTATKKLAGEQTGSEVTRQAIADYVTEHMDMLMHPQSYMAGVRATAFAYYFMFAPRQAVSNFTQIPIYTYSYFAGKLQRDGVSIGKADFMAARALIRATLKVSRMFPGYRAFAGGSAVGATLGALAGAPLGVPAVGGVFGANIGGAIGMKLANKGEFDLRRSALLKLTGLTPLEVEVLEHVKRTGDLDQGYASVMASIHSGASIPEFKQGYRWLNEAGTSYFRASEQANRLITAIAAVDLGLQQGMSPEAIKDWASESIGWTQLIHEPWARAWILRGKKSIATIFLTYQQGVMFRHLSNAVPGRGRSWLMMLAFAGLLGLPLVKDLMRVFDGTYNFAARHFFKSRSPLRNTEVELRKMFGNWSDWVLRGLSANSFLLIPGLSELGGLPKTDISGSVSLDRVIPFSDTYRRAMSGTMGANDVVASVGRDALGVVGTFGSGVMRYSFDSSPKAQQFFQLMPMFLRSLGKALEASSTGKLSNSKGEPVVNFDMDDPAQKLEVLMLALGVASRRETRGREMLSLEKDIALSAQTWLQMIVMNAKQGIITQDPEIMQQWRVQLDLYNRSVPPSMRSNGRTVVTEARKDIQGQALQSSGLPTERKLIDLRKEVQRLYGEPER